MQYPTFYWHYPHGIRSVSNGRVTSVRLSVSSFYSADRIYRSTGAGLAPSSNGAAALSRSTALSSECGQYHVYS